MSVAKQIENMVQAKFAPVHLELVNESSQHGGFVPGKESHFKLTLVAQCFEGLSRIKRHQAVYAELGSVLTSSGGSVHALALHLFAPSEWAGLVPDSPNCKGGSQVQTNAAAPSAALKD